MCENSDDDDETPTGLYFRTIALVKQRNKHEFVRLFNRLKPINKKRVILEICGCDAANCLAAILDGEVGDQSVINYYLSDIGNNMPLHFAARGAKSRIASLLLDKGFSADIRTDFESLHICLKNALPLNVALYYCRYSVWVSHGWKSPIHQVIELCQLDLGEFQDLGERVASLIKDAAYDEKVEVEYDHDEVLRFCNSTETSLDNVKGTWKLRKKLSGRSFDNHTRKFSTKAHSPSWLEERSSRVDVPLPLPTDGPFLASKGARTKYVLSKKRASFSGAAFAKVVRHLRYL